MSPVFLSSSSYLSVMPCRQCAVHSESNYLKMILHTTQRRLMINARYVDVSRNEMPFIFLSLCSLEIDVVVEVCLILHVVTTVFTAGNATHCTMEEAMGGPASAAATDTTGHPTWRVAAMAMAMDRGRGQRVQSPRRRRIGISDWRTSSRSEWRGSG